MTKASKYDRKVKGGKQMYGNGKRCCANELKEVEINKGPIYVPRHKRRVGTEGRDAKLVHIAAKEYQSIAKVPLYLLPIFTDRKTPRTA